MEYRKKLVDFYGGVNKTFVHLKNVERGIKAMFNRKDIDDSEYQRRTNAIKKFKKDLQFYLDNQQNDENLLK